MKVQAQIYQPEMSGGTDGKDPIPPELRSMVKVVVEVEAMYMQIHGIKQVNVVPRGVGICQVKDVSFIPMDVDPPETLVALRNQKARQIADRMFDYGVLGIIIDYAEADKEGMKAQWARMASGEALDRTAQPGQEAQPASSSIETIELNIEDDPSGETVIDESTDKPADK